MPISIATPESVRARLWSNVPKSGPAEPSAFCVCTPWPLTKTWKALSVRIITNCESGQSSLPKYTCWITDRWNGAHAGADQPSIAAIVRSGKTRSHDGPSLPEHWHRARSAKDDEECGASAPLDRGARERG